MLENLSWDDLKRMDNNPPEHGLARRPDVEQSYQEHLAARRGAGITIDDYINQNIMRAENIVLTGNDFPYWIAPDIAHLLLWMRAGHELDIDAARAYVAELAQTGAENIVLFQNHISNRSVKSVPHYQVFIRGR